MLKGTIANNTIVKNNESVIDRNSIIVVLFIFINWFAIATFFYAEIYNNY